jgi:hypothetical protein
MPSKTSPATLSSVTIDTIVTLVMRVRQPMTLEMKNGEVYDIIWNREYRRPEVLKPDQSTAEVFGIIQTIKWLERQPNDITWYAQTKRHIQPGD